MDFLNAQVLLLRTIKYGHNQKPKKRVNRAEKVAMTWRLLGVTVCTGVLGVLPEVDGAGDENN